MPTPADAAHPSLPQDLVPAKTASRMIQGLRSIPLEDYGSGPWLEQHIQLQHLNLQAHLNVQANAEEYVKEALLSLDKLDLLVQELIIAEVMPPPSPPPPPPPPPQGLFLCAL
jgi:hypothetical protein